MNTKPPPKRKTRVHTPCPNIYKFIPSWSAATLQFFTNTLRRTVPGLGLISLLLLALGANLRAGDIEGIISDANTGRFLPGVEVEVVGEGRSAVTDRDGSYRIAGLPAGTYTVEVRYLGYDPTTERVNVPGTGAATLSVQVGMEIVELAAFQVEGYREGRTLALQQKRTANNVMDIISADSVGSLPDRNVAEALSRISGINLDVDSGEGRFVSIRGIEPNFNNVTLDGATLAAPSVGGREGRSMPLDVVGSGQVYQIEVIKSPTPDMDGNALGGTINIKSISAFDQPGRFIFGKLEIGENNDVSGTLVDADLTWGDTFNDGKVGIALSAHYSDRPYISHEIQGSYGQSDGKYYLSTFELQPANGDRQRRGLNYNIEFRPNGDTEFYIRGIFNKFSQDERQQEMIMDTRRDPEFLTATAADFNRMRMEQRDFRREIKQTLLNITAGGKHESGNMTVMGDVTYSFSEEDVPVIKSVQFRTGNENFIDQRFFYEFGGLYPNFDDKGFNTSQQDQFNLRRFREEDSLVQEDTYTPRLDFEWDVEDFMGKRAVIKTGAKFTTRDRFVNDNSVRPVNSDFNMLDIAAPAANSGFSMYGGRYQYPSTLDVDKAFEFLNANRNDFEIDPIESQSNSIEDDYDVSEDILAIYAMSTVQATDDLTIIAGIRWEDTDATLKAFEFQEGETQGGDVAQVVENTGSFAYDNLLPHLHFRYEIDGQTIIRAAFTGTVGRPQYEKASPIAVLEYQELPPEDVLSPGFNNVGELEIGNPQLSPYESINFDLVLEHYLQSGGVFSIGVFNKEIDNPIYEFSDEEDNVTYNGIGFDRLSTTKFLNATSATVKGAELSAQIPFSTFVKDHFLDGFGLDANYTYIRSSVSVFDRVNEDLPFFRQPDEIYNVAFYYQKHNLQARIAWNFQNESLRDLSGNAGSDRWDDSREFTDIQASYKINDNYTFYLNWQNIFDAEKIQTYGRRTNRLRKGEYYGSYIRAGLRFNWR